MTQEFHAKERRDEPSTAKSRGKKVPDQRDCGPSVDTWPILDSEGQPIPGEPGKADRKPGH